MIIDTLEDKGVFNLSDIEYKGNFTINFYSKDELILLQEFFGVRRSKFDMKLLEKRDSLKSVLEGFKYEKGFDSRDSEGNRVINNSSRKKCYNTMEMFK